MNGWFLLLGVLALGGGGFLLWSGWRRRTERRLIASRETVDAIAVTPGPTEVYGAAEPTDGGPMTAPFTDDDCLLAEWEIEEWDASGKSSSWRTRGSGTLAVPFRIDDGADAVEVDADDADVELAGDRRTIEVGIDEEPPRPVRRFLELDSTPGEASGSLFSALEWGTKTGDRRYHQRIVTPGEAVYAHGTATRVESRAFGDRNYEIRAKADDGHRDAELFLIADSDESDLLEARGDAELRLAFGALALVAGLAVIALGLL
jgi:hypothetical protein